jgi:hypothetical protein
MSIYIKLKLRSNIINNCFFDFHSFSLLCLIYFQLNIKRIRISKKNPHRNQNEEIDFYFYLIELMNDKIRNKNETNI